MGKVSVPPLPSTMASASVTGFSPLPQDKHPATSEEKLVIVAPTSVYKKFLHMAYDTSGHQGTAKTLTRLSEFTYWVGMARDAGQYCTCCVTCQKAKAPARPPAPLQPIVTTRPWELVAVDILKVPPSNRGNNYLLVAQDYFSKWQFAIALPNQNSIVKALRDQVFTVVGTPSKTSLGPKEKFRKPHPLSYVRHLE